MENATTFFGETFYHANSASTQAGEEEGCCPWSDEVQNFRKQPIYRPRRHAAQPHRRYTSQLDHPSPKAKDEPRDKEPLLPFHSVTIQYDCEHTIKSPYGTKPSHLKLPSLAARRRSLQAEQTIETGRERGREKEQWGVLGDNRRGSLKRYSRRHCEESPPHF